MTSTVDGIIRNFIDDTGFRLTSTRTNRKNLWYFATDELTGVQVGFNVTLNKRGYVKGFVYANSGFSQGSEDDLAVSVKVNRPYEFLTAVAPILASRPAIGPENVWDFARTIDSLPGVAAGPASTYVHLGGGTFDAYA